MRIAIVASPHVPVPPVKYGGTELVISNLIEGLNELGHEVILLASGDSKSSCELVPIVDKAIYFPSSGDGLPEFNRQIESINQRTEKLLYKLENKVDIIHSHGFDLSNFQKTPNVTTLHGPIDFKQLQYYLKRKYLPYISISKNQQDAVPQLNYVGVVYNGEDGSKFPFVENPDDYVCFLGRFDREKNPHLAIQLAINLGIKIKVAGKIDFEGDGYFEEQVAKYFDNPLVEYLGEIGFEDKVELLSHAKCNLHPTGFREPFGLTVLEAAYCGTPTLAIARGSMPELIEESRTGMLVEDFVEGYHHIQACFDMDRKYIADRARMLFNYKTMSRDYVRVYKRVLRSYKVRQAFGKWSPISQPQLKLNNGLLVHPNLGEKTTFRI
jgi:glycosyltransferase involved in cell wall biosynthesis